MSQADDDLSPLPPAEEAALLGALEAALRPTELSAAVNARLIELALEDPLAPATEEELAESARLRDALEHGSQHEDTATLAALRAAFDATLPSDVARPVHAAVEHALRRRKASVIYATFGAAGALMAAAAVALLFFGVRSTSEPASDVASMSAARESELAKPRSTAALFSERFETGETSARIDAIASARSRDLRDNRFAVWGVR